MRYNAILLVMLLGAISSANAQSVGGINERTVIEEHSASPISLASVNGARVYIAWQEEHSSFLRIEYSFDNGRAFPYHFRSPTEGYVAPSIASYKNRLFVAWSSEKDGQLNIAEVTVGKDGVPTGVALSHKYDSPYFTDSYPIFASTPTGLFITWIGKKDNHINISPVKIIR